MIPIQLGVSRYSFLIIFGSEREGVKRMSDCQRYVIFNRIADNVDKYSLL